MDGAPERPYCARPSRGAFAAAPPPVGSAPVTGPSVTVIVPTHNRTHLLATTLRTVLWQEDVDLEVIVVDDGSSEDVRRAIEQLGDLGCG